MTTLPIHDSVRFASVWRLAQFESLIARNKNEVTELPQWPHCFFTGSVLLPFLTIPPHKTAHFPAARKSWASCP